MAKLIVAFRNFANAPKNPHFVRPEVSLPYSHGLSWDSVLQSLQPARVLNPMYILASPYLRHCSGRFTSYFPN